MQNKGLLKISAIISIISAAFIAAGFTLLGMTFGYPDIIRAETSVILGKMYEQQDTVPYIFYLLSIGALLLIFVSFFLKKLFDGTNNIFAELGQICGIITGILFGTGILRYFTLFPLLAEYQAKGANPETIDIVFNSFQTYTGQTITEHVMFMFLSLMTLMFSIAFIKSGYLNKFVAYFGILSAIILFYGNFELFGLPMTFVFNRYGSDLCGVWLLLVGIFLLFKKELPKKTEGGILYHA